MKTISLRIIGLLVFVGVFFGLYQYFWEGGSTTETSLGTSVSSPHYPGVLRFRYMDLPAGILARSGDLEFQESELRGVAYESLLVEAEEVFFALAYKQFLSKSLETESLVYGAPFQRSVSSILNQYGVKENPNLTVKFTGPDDSSRFLSVDDEVYYRNDVKTESLLWNGILSRLFRLKLKLSEEGLKKKALAKVAQENQQSLQDYRSEKIFQGQEFSPKEQAQRVNYFLEKYVLEMPILVSMKPPEINLELRQDWTPNLGSPQSGLTVTVFGDFYSKASQVLLSGLAELSEVFPQVAFHFRPFFPRSDRYQLMVAEMAICLWSQDPNQLWAALPVFFEARGADFEQKLLAAAKAQASPMKAVKDCYLQRQFKDVVEYHLKTGEFWNVMSLPTALVGGEAFVGPVSIEVLREAIGRHLEVPTAAVWNPPEVSASNSESMKAEAGSRDESAADDEEPGAEDDDLKENL